MLFLLGAILVIGDKMVLAGVSCLESHKIVTVR